MAVQGCIQPDFWSAGLLPHVSATLPSSAWLELAEDELCPSSEVLIKRYSTQAQVFTFWHCFSHWALSELLSVALRVFGLF